MILCINGADFGCQTHVVPFRPPRAKRRRHHAGSFLFIAISLTSAALCSRITLCQGLANAQFKARHNGRGGTSGLAIAATNALRAINLAFWV